MNEVMPGRHKCSGERWWEGATITWAVREGLSAQKT